MLAPGTSQGWVTALYLELLSHAGPWNLLRMDEGSALYLELLSHAGPWNFPRTLYLELLSHAGP